LGNAGVLRSGCVGRCVGGGVGRCVGGGGEGGPCPYSHVGLTQYLCAGHSQQVG
jgi:hypothetical protein